MGKCKLQWPDLGILHVVILLLFVIGLIQQTNGGGQFSNPKDNIKKTALGLEIKAFITESTRHWVIGHVGPYKDMLAFAKSIKSPATTQQENANAESIPEKSNKKKRKEKKGETTKLVEREHLIPIQAINDAMPTEKKKTLKQLKSVDELTPAGQKKFVQLNKHVYPDSNSAPTITMLHEHHKFTVTFGNSKAGEKFRETLTGYLNDAGKDAGKHVGFKVLAASLATYRYTFYGQMSLSDIYAEGLTKYIQWYVADGKISALEGIVLEKYFGLDVAPKSTADLPNISDKEKQNIKKKLQSIIDDHVKNPDRSKVRTNSENWDKVNVKELFKIVSEVCKDVAQPIQMNKEDRVKYFVVDTSLNSPQPAVRKERIDEIDMSEQPKVKSDPQENNERQKKINDRIKTELIDEISDPKVMKDYCDNFKRFIDADKAKQNSAKTGEENEPDSKKRLAEEDISPDKKKQNEGTNDGEIVDENNNESDKPKVLEFCAQGGRRRKRSAVCNVIDADELEKKFQEVSDDQKTKLISEVEDIGIDKLSGKEESINKIKSRVKRFKSKIFKASVAAAKLGGLFNLMHVGAKAAEKTFASPKVLAGAAAENFEATDLESKPTKKQKPEYEPSKYNERAQKVVKYVNIGMVGRQFIGGALEGDIEGIINMTALFVGGKAADKIGDGLTHAGKHLSKAGTKGWGRTLKMAGPLVGNAMLGLNVYNFVNQVNAYKDLKNKCTWKNQTFQESFDRDCGMDQDMAVVNITGEAVSIALGVASTVVAILTAFSVATGPWGVVIAALDVAVAIGMQITTAVLIVNKLDKSLNGGLRFDERIEEGFRAFLGMSPSPHIQKLLDRKASMNNQVEQNINFLKSNLDYEIYVTPTTYKEKYNCKCDVKIVWRLLAYLFTGGNDNELFPDIKKTRNCDFEDKSFGEDIQCEEKELFFLNSQADFRYKRRVTEGRVIPDKPVDHGLVCNPNEESYYGDKYSYLCNNIIAVQSYHRQGKSAKFDLDGGSDVAFGFPHQTNVFEVGPGYKQYTGGLQEDIFILQSYPLQGFINGNGSSKNSLLFGSQTLKYTVQEITIDLSSSSYQNIQQVFGRSDLADKVTANCDTTIVDLQGGNYRSRFTDVIVIPNRNCNYSLDIFVKSHTHVKNYQQNGGSTFKYLVSEGTHMFVNVSFIGSGNKHIFKLEINPKYFTIETVSKNSLKIRQSIVSSFQTTFVKESENFVLLTTSGMRIAFDGHHQRFTAYGFVSNMIQKTEQIETVEGLANYKNVFFIDVMESIEISGGYHDDVFKIQNLASGTIEGGPGINSIEMDYSVDLKHFNTIDFLTGKINTDGITRWTFQNIQRLFGIAGVTENVIANCNLEVLNLQGGNSNASDNLTIPHQSHCNYNMTCYLAEFSILNSYQSRPGSKFLYHVLFGPNITVVINIDNETEHRFVFLNDITPAWIQYINGRINIWDIHNRFESSYHPEATNLYFETNSGVFIKFDTSSRQIYGLGTIGEHSNMTIIGLKHYRNQFSIGGNASELTVVGGDSNDYFIFEGSSRGTLKGGKGTDLLDCTHSFPLEPVILFDFNSGTITTNGTILWKFASIEEFRGRKHQAEAISVSCDVRKIDSGGGHADVHDAILIPDGSDYGDCFGKDDNLQILVRKYTTVENEGKSGAFHYELQELTTENNSSIINVDMDEASEAEHRYLFPQKINQVDIIEFDIDDRLMDITFQDGVIWSGYVNVNNSHFVTSDRMKILLIPEIRGVIRPSVTMETSEGLVNHPNIFLLDEPTGAKCIGGRDSDIFGLSSSEFHGEIDGRAGMNVLALSETFWPFNYLIIKCSDGTISTNDTNTLPLKFENVQGFVGRKDQGEVIVAACGTVHIDTKGSSSVKKDLIVIPMNRSCVYALKVSLRPNLTLMNHAIQGNFSYEGTIESANTTLELPFRGDAMNHEIALQFNFSNVDRLYTENKRLYLKKGVAWFSTNYYIDEQSDFHSQPKIVFLDGLQLKIGKYGNTSFSVFGKYHEEHTRIKRMADKLPRGLTLNAEFSDLKSYKAASKRLQTNAVIQLDESTMLSIGAGGDLDIITAIPRFKNYLIGNGANGTVYRIGDQTVEAIIYHDDEAFSNETQNRAVVDFFPIIQNRRGIYPETDLHINDIQFSLENTTVKLITNTTDRSLESILSQWQVLLRTTFLDLTCGQTNCSMVPRPIVIDPRETEIVLLTPEDFETGAKIIIKKPDGDHEIPLEDMALEPMRLDNDLVLSNLFRNASQNHTVSVTIFNFYSEGVAQELQEKLVQIGFEGEEEFLNLNTTVGENIRTFEERGQIFDVENFLVNLDESTTMTSPTTALNPMVIDEYTTVKPVETTFKSNVYNNPFIPVDMIQITNEH